MGGKNPLKQAFKAVTGIVTKPLEAGAKLIGAKGLARGIDKFGDKVVGATSGIIDATSGKASQMKKDAAAESARQMGMAQAAEAEKSRQAQAAESARMDSERMSAGSKSRTLLTGPAGLDEEESITRRTLAGY